MHKFHKTMAALGAAAMLIAPAAAGAVTNNDAEQLRRLDIMLMVTSLRCRTGSDNFQPQYGKFSSAHLTTLNAAAKQLETKMTGQHGAKGAKRALDKISVSMANDYGNGHPWLSCGELKKITTDLAASKNPADLSLAANDLLAATPGKNNRFAAR